jgi:hypothetical protein
VVVGKLIIKRKLTHSCKLRAVYSFDKNRKTLRGSLVKFYLAWEPGLTTFLHEFAVAIICSSAPFASSAAMRRAAERAACAACCI